MAKNSEIENSSSAAVALKPKFNQCGRALHNQSISDTVRDAKPTHFDSVQAMRGLSVLGVVFYHIAMRHRQDLSQFDASLVYPLSLLGHCGVDLFFVISGFIIAIVNWKHFGDKSAIGEYAIKRFIRVFPIYWLTCLPFFFFSAISLDTKSILGALALLPHYAICINMVAWTLSYEVAFYALFALLLLLPVRYLPFCMVLWAMLIVGDAIAPAALVSVPFLHAFLRPLNLEFILGLSLAVLLRRNILFARPAVAVLLGVLGLVVTASFKHFGPDPFLPEGNELLRALVFGGPSALFLYAAISWECLYKTVFPKFLLLMGDASYSIYLTHFVLIKVLMLNPLVSHFEKPYQLYVWEAMIFFFVLALGIFIHLKLEKPLIDFLKRRLVH